MPRVAEGDASQVVEAFAVFVEKVKDVRIPENELRKPEVVLSALKNLLYGPSGRWLLCIDNVDNAGDADVFGMLDNLAAFADSERSNVGCW